MTIFAGGFAVFGKEGRSVEVDHVAMLADDECGGHGEARPDHVADHDAEALAFCLVGNEERLGEASALVELDVDDVEAANKSGNVVETKGAFVRGDRDWTAVALEIGFPAALQRLFEKRHPVRAKSVDERVEILEREALLCIDSEPDVGPGGADRRYALD